MGSAFMGVITVVWFSARFDCTCSLIMRPRYARNLCATWKLITRMNVSSVLCAEVSFLCARVMWGVHEFLAFFVPALNQVQF